MTARPLTRWAILMLAAVSGIQAGSVEYFASNRYGLPLTRLAADQTGESEWLLAVHSAEDAAEVGLVAWRRLSGPEGVIREWRTASAKGVLQEEELVDGQLVSRLAFSASGQLEREERYMSGFLAEVDHWVYQQRQPLRMTTVDADGNVVAVREYQLSAVGRLRRVTFAVGEVSSSSAVYDDGSGELALTFRDGRLVQERSTEVGRHMISRFLPSGQRQSLEQSQEGRPLSTSRWTYGQKGAVVDEVVIDYSAGIRIQVDHDDRGRALVQRTWSTVQERGSEGDVDTGGDGVTLLEERWFAWSPAGELLSERAVSDRGLEAWTYRYDAEDTRVGEEYSVRGALVRSTAYLLDDSRTDILYRDGRPALRVFWQGDERVGEELIIDDG